MEKKTLFWAGGVATAVVIALGLWGFAWSEPVNTSTGIFSLAPWAESAEQMPDVVEPLHSDVTSVVESLPDSSEFQSLFRSTGVSAILSANGQYTVFVPTNGAFANLPVGTISDMTMTQLKRLVEYHIVSGAAIQGDAEASGAIEAMSGDPLNFNDTNNIPMVGSALLAGQYRASNGVVYVINSVLIPPQK